jgi:hypothetical protein
LAPDNSAPLYLPGDITVSPDRAGYMIGVTVAEREFSVIATGLPWALAIQRAHIYSVTHGGRVLVSRNGAPFEELDAQEAWLGVDRVWRLHDRATVFAHAPATAGVYVLRATTPIYIGETQNLRERLLYHLTSPSECAQRFGALEFSVQEFVSIALQSRRAARLQGWWLPPCNELG